MFELRNPLLISFFLVFITACTSEADKATFITLTPASTVKPTETPKPTASKLSTASATLTPTHKPPDQILYSPNEEYIAEFDNAYGHPAFGEGQVIEILDKQGLPLWQIPYQHETAMVDPHPGLHIYGWSKDSSYLYFYYQFSPDGGDFAFWWDGFDLQRIEVVSGDIERVIPGEDFIAFAFSPDETQLAYTRAEDNPSIIFIRDLTTGKEKTADVIFPSKNYIRVGGIAWSPSGKELVFHTENDEYMVQTIYLDVVNMKQRMIREYKLWSMWFSGWSDDGKLQFSDFTEVFQLDVKTNETTIIGTPTPYY